jgi:cell wall-associated NlpC family hydrolase
MALAATVLGTFAGVARADVIPTPSVSAESPTVVSASPAASATPSPTPSGDPTAPIPGTRPTTGVTPFPVVASPTTSATPQPTTAPTPVPTLTSGPPSDGVGLIQGQVDQYLALSAERETAQAAVTSTGAALVAAHAATVALESEQVRLAMSEDAARSLVVSTQANTDNVASQMYQQGDGGLGALATVLTTGPDQFISNLNTVTKLHAVGNAAVMTSLTARAELDMTIAQKTALAMRLEAARATEAAAAKANSDAVIALAAIDAQLALLDITPPQVAVGPDGCPTGDVTATLRGGAETFGAAELCRKAVAQAATPQAALAITWAFQHLGASYACGGAGRLLPFRADCSSFVSRSYYEGAGLGTAGIGWAPSTRDMVPWDGVALDPHYAFVAPTGLRPGDLVLYDTCPQGGCAYKHVVMYLGSPDGGKTYFMAHTNSCGDIAKVEPFWGFPTSGHPFLVARRVVALPGEAVVVPTAEQAAAKAAASQTLVTSKPLG